MFTEIAQIKKWLAKSFNLRIEGDGFSCRLLDPVPDGEYIIPLGTSEVLSRVIIKDDMIYVTSSIL